MLSVLTRPLSPRARGRRFVASNWSNWRIVLETFRFVKTFPHKSTLPGNCQLLTEAQKIRPRQAWGSTPLQERNRAGCIGNPRSSSGRVRWCSRCFSSGGLSAFRRRMDPCERASKEESPGLSGQYQEDNLHGAHAQESREERQRVWRWRIVKDRSERWHCGDRALRLS